MINSVKNKIYFGSGVSMTAQTNSKISEINALPENEDIKNSQNIKSVYDVKKASVYKEPNVVHTSWFYINDLHGKMTKMERIYNMAKEFDAMSLKDNISFFKDTPEDKISKFKVSSGDISIGSNLNNNIVAARFLDWSGSRRTSAAAAARSGGRSRRGSPGGTGRGR
jgi:2',3'-cyclic-nucleotide 2'-phosphodiesterase (5'-nucleotidase family)